MNTQEKIQLEIKNAMRAGDVLVKTTLRGAVAAIKQIEIDQRKELDESEIIAVLQKEVKSRKESISDAEKAERPDLIETAKAEIEILSPFLPKAMSEEELRSIINNIIEEIGASSMADMGKVMGAVMPIVKGRADGGQINQVVKQLLS